jgi:putative endonuclease
MMNSRTKGYQGEREARRYLEKEEYSILAQNYYTPYGEIDIIAQKAGRIFFVEVKSWSNISPEFLVGSITKEKRRRIFASAHVFLEAYPQYSSFEWQFDVIFVKDKKINHYPASLEADDIEL